MEQETGVVRGNDEEAPWLKERSTGMRDVSVSWWSCGECPAVTEVLYLCVVAQVASATLKGDKKCKIQRSSSADYSES